MKLEEKKLLAYLPYKPKVQWIREDDNETIISDLTISDYDFLIRKKQAKLILFPLSMLTEEIEINGKKFIPIEELKWLRDGSECLDEWYEHMRDMYISPENINFNHCPYIFLEKLHEWKFDTFGLIDSGLAIPVTKEFNPYK